MKLVVTDPCYLIDSNDEWRKVLGDFTNVNQNITEYLEKVLGIKTYLVEDTFYGDWQNYIFDNAYSSKFENKVVQSEFCADAGLVCIVEYNEKLEKILKNEPNYLYALLETNANEIDVKYDKEECQRNQWLYFKIVDKKTNELLFESREKEYDDDDDDDEYFNDDEY